MGRVENVNQFPYHTSARVELIDGSNLRATRSATTTASTTVLGIIDRICWNLLEVKMK